ncbi:MAG: hypothetical protein ACRDKV_02285 [Solirubrobacterales bacterium]
MNETVRLTFNDTEQVPADSPDASHLPSRFDADPAISAEIAVERGEATLEQKEFVDALNADYPLLVSTGHSTEYELPRRERRLASGLLTCRGAALAGSRQVLRTPLEPFSTLTHSARVPLG